MLQVRISIFEKTLPHDKNFSYVKSAFTNINIHTHK